MKVSVEHWWIDTDRRTLRYCKKNLPHCHFVDRKCHVWIVTGSNLVHRVERLVTNGRQRLNISRISLFLVCFTLEVDSNVPLTLLGTAYWMTEHHIPEELTPQRHVEKLRPIICSVGPTVPEASTELYQYFHKIVHITENEYLIYNIPIMPIRTHKFHFFMFNIPCIMDQFIKK
jgi:hypothetical protein